MPGDQVDTNSRLDSVLALSSVNLPGGELRRRSAEDELSMRRYLQEGDIISAEVRARGSVPDPYVFGPSGSESFPFHIKVLRNEILLRK